MSSFSQIYKWVALETGIHKEEIISPKRYPNIVSARALFIILCSRTGFSCTAIAKELKRDHTSVLHLINTRSDSEYVKKILSKYEENFKKSDLINNEKIQQHLRFKGLTNGKRVYKEVYEKYGGKCMVCSFDEIVEIHHIIPRYLGGSDEITNLALLCPNHHALADRGALQIKGKLELIHKESVNPQH